jgi:hypothetical protein
MSAFLDVIAAMLFGGALFGIILDSNDLAAETQMVYNGDMMVQQMLTSTVQLVEGELRNIGFGLPSAQPAIRLADSTSMTFLSDIDRDGSVDTIAYSVGAVSEIASTPNELDRFLKRSVNHEGIQNIGVVTLFSLRYFTQSGALLPTPVPSSRVSEIYTVELTVEVQNPVAPARDPSMVKAGERDALYSSSLWQQTRLASQNNRR